MKTAEDQLSEAIQEAEYSFSDAEIKFIIEAMKAYSLSCQEVLREKIAEKPGMSELIKSYIRNTTLIEG